VGYFVVVLLQLTLLSPLLAAAFRRHPHGTLIISLAVNAGALGWFYAVANGRLPNFGLAVPVPMPAILFPCWLFPFALGMYCAQARTSIRAFFAPGERKILLGAVCAVAIVFLLLEAYGWREVRAIALSQLRFSAFFFASAVSLASVALHRRLKPNILSVLGQGSFLIYLTHMRLFAFYNLLPFQASPFVRYLIILVTLSVLYYAGLVVSRRIVPRRLAELLGVA
jgi:membrane-bound acyltransferase YfiQ involved in biofilm formation